jgi:hypothetical protein
VDTQSNKFYTTLAKAAPYIMIGMVFSVFLNYIMMKAMGNASPESLGWPFHGGSMENGHMKFSYIGLGMNYVVWSIITAIMVPLFKQIFLSRSQNG